MATLNEIAFTICLVRPLDSLLNSATASTPTTEPGYVRLLESASGNLGPPWPRSGDHWSRFWSNYLRIDRLASTNPRQLWSFGVPFEVVDPGPVDHVSNDVETGLRVLLYPAAVCALVSARLRRPLPMIDAAVVVAHLRQADEWLFHGHRRSLEGIAADAASAAVARHFGLGASGLGSADEYTVTSVISASDPGSQLQLSEPAAQRSLVGLANLSGPGAYDHDQLLVSENPRHSGRLYLTESGLGVWQESDTVELMESGPHERPDWFWCLHRNQCELVTHVAALVSALRWADGAREEHRMTPKAVPYIKNVVCERLRLLSDKSTKTYRSDVAKRRIEPHLEALARVSHFLR